MIYTPVLWLVLAELQHCSLPTTLTFVCAAPWADRYIHSPHTCLPVGHHASQAQALRQTPVWLQVFQGTALSLVLRFSRTQAGTQYLGSVTVIFTEAAKLLICVVAQLSVCRQDFA